MKTRIFTFVASLVVLWSVSLGVASAQDAKPAPAAEYQGPVARLLHEFAAAVASLDVQGMEGLFLPPDDSPDGENRRENIREMKKDWKRAKGKDAPKITVAFENTVTTVRTDMVVGSDKVAARAIPVEIKVAFTKDGAKIVALKYLTPEEAAKEAQSETPQKGGDAKKVDTSDPQQVAEAAWRAVIAKDYAKARTFVVPDDRDDFTKENLEEELTQLPPLPKSPIVKVELNGDRAEAKLENWDFEEGLEMVKRDGRWWIEK